MRPLPSTEVRPRTVGWWERLKAWLWPRPKPPRTPLERWQDSYANWLDELQNVFAAFPDHSDLEGHPLSEAEGRVLDDIANLYAEDACAVLEQLVLRGESLRRLLERRRGG